MTSFHVYAGWLTPEEQIGTCHIDRARGNEVISFSYDAGWLRAHTDFFLDPDLMPVEGRQYPPDNKPCFGFLEDAAPDRWGRRLMDRRERIDAEKENRPAKKLLESDYILGVHDTGRQGALRFYDPDTQQYLSTRDILAAPPITGIRELEQASLNLEKSSGTDAAKWLRNLIDPGSSLGGARPKANVTDEKGEILIAKFPSQNDSINVGAWEMTVHDLAQLAGLGVPDARLMRLSDAGDTYLVKRFDRKGDRRIHYASAMTMLGKTDRDADGSDYLDIVSVIEQISAQPDRDLLALWMRAVFSVCVSNTDNHLRNHGFILEKDGWRLSPAFDINPTVDQTFFALGINGDDSKNLNSVIGAASYFRISREEAKERAAQIAGIVRDNWEDIAQKHRIARQERAVMKEAFFI